MVCYISLLIITVFLIGPELLYFEYSSFMEIYFPFKEIKTMKFKRYSCQLTCFFDMLKPLIL